MIQIRVYICLLLLAICLPAEAALSDKSGVPNQQSDGVQSEMDCARIEVIKSLLKNKDTKEYAYIEARRLIEKFDKSKSYGALGQLYLILGDSEGASTDHKGSLKFGNISYNNKLKSALHYYNRSLNNFEKVQPLPLNDYQTAFTRNVDIRIKRDGLFNGAKWGLSKIENTNLSTPDQKIVLLSILLDLIKLHENETADKRYLVVKYHSLVYLKELSVQNPNGHSINFINTDIETLSKNPAFQKQINTIVDSEKIPHQSILLQLAIVFALWGLAFILVYFLSAKLRPVRLRNNSYLLWSDNNVFSVCQNDRLSKYFIINNNLSLPIIFTLVFVLGFCLLTILNDIEGTLWNTPLFQWTYFRCVSDPINWAIIIPFFFIFLRSYYNYIPFSLNAFYVNLLPHDEKTKGAFLLELSRWSYFFNFPWKNSIILVMAFIGASAGYLSLGRSMEFYGMAPINSNYVFLNNFLVRYPTITGCYVIIILTIVIYAILNAGLAIAITIYMFRTLYSKFSDKIIPNPFNIDRHGGMAFSGRLAIRMMIVVSTALLLGSDLILRDYFIIGKPFQIYCYLMFPLYIFIAPLPFIIPIMDARQVLLQMRDKVMNGLEIISIKARDEFFQNASLHISPETSNEIAKDLTVIMETGNRILALDYPVWPINVNQLNAFLTIFIIPVVIPVILHTIILMHS